MVTWIDALAKTRRVLAGRWARVFTRPEKLSADEAEDLEAALLRADVPVRLATQWVAELDKAYGGLRVSRRDMLRKMLVTALQHETPFAWRRGPPPCSILVVGVNGSGKTTTCAKLAAMALREGRRPLLGAADTFRAAGSEQLKLWAQRVGCPVVGGASGADAAAVAYDAVDAAVARQADVLILDTAGRMHTRQPLMQELRKVRQAMNKRLDSAPEESWIVLDAALGQNAISQVRQFHEAVPLTGVVVAKLDGSSKAGFLFAVRKELDLPVRFVGLGEGPNDLAPFQPEEFVDSMLPDEKGGAGCDPGAG